MASQAAGGGTVNNLYQHCFSIRFPQYCKTRDIIIVVNFDKNDIKLVTNSLYSLIAISI